MIGEKELQLLGKDGLLVNVARGEVVQEEALYNTLTNKLIQGAAIDVWYDYQPTPDANDKKFPYHFPFHELDNIVLSPHRAGSPKEALARFNDVIFNINQLATGSCNFVNVVDFSRGY